ncbi:MAG: TetR family transcriptional regulator [Acidimicrobiales bacterium]
MSLRSPASAAPAGEPEGRCLSLSDVVARTGVPASTIHHYRKAGLVPRAERVATNRLCYGEDHVQALLLIRTLRESRGLSLDRIAVVLPELRARSARLAPPRLDEVLDRLAGDARRRLLDVAIAQFSTYGYAKVTISAIASRAGMAKGTVYRHFQSKEELFAAVVDDLVDDTARQFAAAIDGLGGPEGLAANPERASLVFARLVAKAMPILLEVGVRAAKGHDGSDTMARQVLRKLAGAAGRPLAGDAITSGLAVLRDAFATVLEWAVRPEWPPEAEAGSPA